MVGAAPSRRRLPAGDEARRWGFADAVGADPRRAGYEWAHHGQGSGTAWRCLAGRTRRRGEGLPGTPGYPDPESVEARAVRRCATGRVYSVRAQRREVGSDHYDYKLTWLKALRDAVLSAGPSSTIVCGDINIAPADDDVFDPAAFAGHTHVTDVERAALAAVVDTDLSTSSVRGGRGAGLQLPGLPRRDVPPTRDAHRPDPRRCRRRTARRGGICRPAGAQGTKPSDHAPVIVDLDTAP